MTDALRSVVGDPVGPCLFPWEDGNGPHSCLESGAHPVHKCTCGAWWPVDAEPFFEHETARTMQTVVLTLRQVAGWMPMSSEELHETAAMVERHGADEMCCPMCEEIECDDGCPLATVRKEPSR